MHARLSSPGGLLLAAALTAAMLMAPLTGSTAAATAATTTATAEPKVARSANAVTVSVPASVNTPGYTLDVATDELALTTRRAGKTVLATTSGDTGALRFTAADGTWQHATGVTDWTWKNGVLTVTADSTLDGATVEARITPGADRYQLDWDVHGGTPTQLGLTYDLSSAGHWYGHGEAETPQGGPGTNQPWPLDAGEVDHKTFGPASYHMIDPFWYTSKSTGLRVDTGNVMDVALNKGKDGLGSFIIESPDTYKATVFVESTPLEVYRDYIGIVGKPTKSDAPYEQYAKPLWNSWAQFYTKVDQEKLLDYATDLHDNGLDGHTIQLDDKWESNYGNLTWDPKTFPDPKGLSKKIHDMGFDFGVWVTLWINLALSANYQHAVDHGYLLMDAKDKTKPCDVTWWNGEAGIIDLADPEAKAWYEGNLKSLMGTRDTITWVPTGSFAGSAEERFLRYPMTPHPGQGHQGAEALRRAQRAGLGAVGRSPPARSWTTSTPWSATSPGPAARSCPVPTPRSGWRSTCPCSVPRARSTGPPPSTRSVPARRCPATVTRTWSAPRWRRGPRWMYPRTRRSRCGSPSTSPRGPSPAPTPARSRSTPTAVPRARTR
ncbi:hypothetical protein SALBM311S_05071 [Streptomyces alboniger]